MIDLHDIHGEVSNEYMYTCSHSVLQNRDLRANLMGLLAHMQTSPYICTSRYLKSVVEAEHFNLFEARLKKTFLIVS